MIEKIVEIINESNYGLTISEIADKLNIKDIELYQKLLEEIKKLEENFDIYKTKKEKYISLENSHLKKGKLSINEKGFGFLLLKDEKDIFISSKNLNGALNNNLVIVEVTTKKNDLKPEGRVLKVIERTSGNLVGKVYYKKGIMYVDLDDKKNNIDVKIIKGKSKGAAPDHKVVVKLKNKISPTMYEGEIEKILGHKNDPGIDIVSIIEKHNIKYKFNEETMREAEKIPTEIDRSKIDKRRDLRDKLIFTIDGKDAKDLDDAIRVEKLDNGNYFLGVYIADVANYVKENSEIDKEAYERGTSVYLVDRVIPMLPHVLSNGICSLNGNVDRFAVACDMEIDHKGNIVTYDIYEAVINSKKRMDYNSVNNILEKGIIEKGYEDFVETLKLSLEIAHVLRKNKQKRGYIEFETEEAKIIVDKNCKPIKIDKRERGEGQKLIEDFMIAANETVASHLFYQELPSIYRVHGKPKEEKLEEFLGFVSHMGYQITGKNKLTYSTEIQKILKQLKEQCDENEYLIVSDLLLRSMKKAKYSNENEGHFGLGSKCYSHFTSPIRRYPDTILHRLLKVYLFNGDISENTQKKWNSKLIEISDSTSNSEVKAVECEREVESMKMAEYMESHIGEQYKGVISGITNFGLFIKLDNLIEGLVHISELNDDHYNYNKNILAMVGERTNKTYKIGDKVEIEVIKASKETKNIDFKLVKRG